MPKEAAVSTNRDTVSVACPKCGHMQLEPKSAYSTRCKKCHEHFRLEAALKPPESPNRPAIEQRRIRCFQCGTELEAPKAASSTMCKRCSSHVDLSDYQVNQTVSKNFRTHGRLVVTEKGYVLNTEAHVGEAVVKGRLIGKLTTEGALEIHSSASIKGSFSAGCLVIPAGNHFSWAKPLEVKGAEISGELVADLHSKGTVRLNSSARLFGNVEAANLVVAPGAVFVGSAKIGAKTSSEG
jgi:cytoskeletal protein CcmA (bactofilin family)